MLGELLFLLGVEFVGVFRQGFEGVSGFGKVAIQLFHVGIVRFLKAVRCLQRGVAEPFLFVLCTEFLQPFFHFIDVIFIDHGVLGELLKLGVDLRPCLWLAGRGGGGGLPRVDRNQQADGEQDNRSERRSEGFRQMPFQAFREI